MRVFERVSKITTVGPGSALNTNGPICAMSAGVNLVRCEIRAPFTWTPFVERVSSIHTWPPV